VVILTDVFQSRCTKGPTAFSRGLYDEAVKVSREARAGRNHRGVAAITRWSSMTLKPLRFGSCRRGEGVREWRRARRRLG